MIAIAPAKRLLAKLFAIALVLLAGLLAAARPIPSVYSSNDTGRYLGEFWLACASGADQVGLVGTSWFIFQLTASMFCWDESGRVLLFVMASCLPLTLIAVAPSDVSRSALAIAVVFSVYVFELATNALRQSVSVAVLLLAFSSALSRKVLVAMLLCALASVIHYSSAVYIPLVLLIPWLSSGRASERAGARLVLLLCAIAVVALGGVGEAALIGGGLVGARLEWYTEASSVQFFSFMVLPIVLTPIILDGKLRRRVASVPLLVSLYGVAVIAGAQIVAPAIVFRFSFTAFVIGVFAYVCSEQCSINRVLIFIAVVIAHSVAYVLISGNARSVLFG